MKIAWRIGATILLAAGPAGADGQSRDIERLRASFRDGHAAVFGKSHHLARAPQGPARGTSATRGYDVEHYDLTLDVLDGTLAGTVRVMARATTSLTDVVLDLGSSLTPGAITSSNGVAGATHEDDLLTISLETPADAGTSFLVTVPYAGPPAAIDGPITTPAFSFLTYEHPKTGAEAPVIYSLSVPWRSGAWWPCKEDLSDRATIDLHVTVPDSLVVASNGLLLGVDDLGNGRHTYNWSHGHPVSPYLVAVHISNYVHIEDSVDVTLPEGGSVTIPLDYYVFPHDEILAEMDFSRMGLAMQHLSSRFGPYPFADEKYAMATAPFSGGMEHQTCSTIGDRFIRGDRFYEWVFVHELAHQWWGDHVTLADWRDVWLNEGFATYTEALWTEYITTETSGEAAGRDAYRAYMDLLDAFPPPDGGSLQGRIYDPAGIFVEAPYDKGAWVLHMLRGVLGEDLFFGTGKGLEEEDAATLGVFRAYRRTYGGLSAPEAARPAVTTEAFRDVVKEVVGAADDPPVDADFLDAFFEQWIYQPQRPDYRLTWTATPSGSGYDVAIGIRQVQSHHDVYEMPLEIEVTFQDLAPVRMTVMNDRREQGFGLHVDASPTAVILDPDRWVLRNIPSVTVTAPAAVPLLTRNPALQRAGIYFLLTERTGVAVKLFDGHGRLVRTLSDGQRRSAGRHTLEWDGIDDRGNPSPSGVYYVTLDIGKTRETTRLVYLR